MKVTGTWEFLEFLTFINDLPSQIADGLVLLFADDTTVIECARTYDVLNIK